MSVAAAAAEPVQLLAAAAREIGAGRLDQRVEPQSNDEFGSLVDAFNTMAGELATSRRKIERSTIEIERKHLEVEGRSRYIETILERITTGVVSVDAAGAITTINGAASRLLSLDRSIIGQPARAVLARPDLQPLAAMLAAGGRVRADEAAHELTIPRAGQELHMAVVATALTDTPSELTAASRAATVSSASAAPSSLTSSCSRKWLAASQAQPMRRKLPTTAASRACHLPRKYW